MKLKKIEIALTIAVILTIAVSAVPAAASGGVYEKTIRLHVVANSDSEEDQRVKLLVRDRLISEYSALMKDCVSLDKAEKALSDKLPEIRAAAADELEKNGFSYGACADLKKMHFDTRDYEYFSLPAGDYNALYVVLGSGKGKNWWCVVFPPLLRGFVGVRSQGERRQRGF